MRHLFTMTTDVYTWPQAFSGFLLPGIAMGLLVGFAIGISIGVNNCKHWEQAQ